MLEKESEWIRAENCGKAVEVGETTLTLCHTKQMRYSSSVQDLSELSHKSVYVTQFPIASCLVVQCTNWLNLNTLYFRCSDT